VEKVDANLGTVLGALPDLDSTVIVYVSDHGDSLGEHGLPFKGPYMYEDVIHIPCVVRAPWAFAGQDERDDLITSADIAPTLASLCSVEWPKRITGRDLTRNVKPRDAVFLEYYSKQKWVNPIRTIRTRQWKLNWYDRGHQELYDLKADPHEVKNRAGDPALRTIQTQLEQQLNAWRGPLT
jgi:arylsulfatase A-like enzyme